MKKEILKEIIYHQSGRWQQPVISSYSHAISHRDLTFAPSASSNLISESRQYISRNKNELILQNLNNPHAVIIKGVRRCGKSTLLNQFVSQHFKDKFYYLNFEDERLLNFGVDDFNHLYEVFVELYGERKIFYFDEIQNVAHWEVFVRRMQDSGFKFFITGSNASLLSREMGTRLTGRHADIELFPFSFSEFLTFQQAKFSIQDYYDAKNRGYLRNLYNQYLQFGGMPEFLLYKQDTLMISTYEDILFRDIISRHEIKDIKALRELALYLITNMARPFSYNQLKNCLSLGSITTIKNYIEYLEDCYLLFQINQFSFSLKQQITNNKKVYVIDNGLANVVAFQFSRNRGQFLENLIFLELRRRGKEIYFYKTKNNLEIDFLIRQGRDIESLIQVAFELKDEKTKQREIKALLSAMDELNLDTGLIITDNHKDEIKIDNKLISVIPAYQWLLQES